MPVLRPLIAFDKEEIVALAKEIGTYRLSLKPYQDVCSIRAQHPATWASMNDVLRLESTLHLDTVLAETLDQRETVRIDW
jgi:thiamine biosynthesis protein ThiI